MPRRSFALPFALFVAFGLSAASCSDSTGPSAEMRAVAGNYWAHAESETLDALGTFTVTENGVTADMLEGGAFIGVILDASGAMDGRLIVPGEIDERLTGRWTLDRGVVRFSHSADTFLRDMAFQARDGRLEAQSDFGDVTVHVILEQPR